MKTLLPCLLSLALLPSFALGLAGQLPGPSIGYRSDIDAATKKKIDALYKFMNEELKFLEGSFINQFTNQSFGGSAEKVVEFIQLLKGIGQWKIDVQFRDFGKKETMTAFSTDQNTGNDHIRVMVNSGRKDFELNQFKAFLPKPKLPSTKETTTAKGEGMKQEFLYLHCFRKTWGMRVPSPNADKDPPTPPKALLTLRVYPDTEFELLGGENSYRLKGIVSQERNGVVKVKLEGAFGNSVHVYEGEAKLDERTRRARSIPITHTSKSVPTWAGRSSPTSSTIDARRSTRSIRDRFSSPTTDPKDTSRTTTTIPPSTCSRS